MQVCAFVGVAEGGCGGDYGCEGTAIGGGGEEGGEEGALGEGEGGGAGSYPEGSGGGWVGVWLWLELGMGGGGGVVFGDGGCGRGRWWRWSGHVGDWRDDGVKGRATECEVNWWQFGQCLELSHVFYCARQMFML